MADIDRLDIKINSDTDKAVRSLGNLEDKLSAVSKTLSQIDTKGLQKFSSSMTMLSTGMKTLQGVKLPDYKRVVNGIKKFESIDGAKIAAATKSLKPLANSIRTLSGVQFNGNSITSFVNAMTRLSNSSVSGLQGVNFDGIGTKLSGLAASLSSAPKVERNTVSLINAVGKLASAGANTELAAQGIYSLTGAINASITTLSGAGKVSDNVIQFSAAIAQLANAGKKTETTAAHLRNLGNALKDVIKTLSTASNVSRNTIQITQAIAQLANAGSHAGSVGRGLANVFNGMSDSANRTHRVMSSAGGVIKKVLVPGFLQGKKSVKGFASSVGMLYARFWVLHKVIKGFGGTINLAQNYIEEFNYFSVAMNKIGQDSKNQWKQAGYSNAESYVDSFKGRFAKLQKQMTSYKVDYNTGDATSDMSHNLGLDLTEVMNYNAAISQITNSAGMLGETSVATSKALSMLSADWSSLSNQDLSAVMDNFQSGLIGQSRALYKYGIDITSAGLSMTALKHGIKANIKDLSQQSKMQLRALTMLEQSKVAYGDLARTINQPANQLRMLHAGFKNLCRTIGSLFIPVVQKLYPYLNAVVMVLQEFAQWVTKLAGIKLGGDSGPTALPDYGDAADGADDLANSTDKASKAQKKLNDNLQGFDEIHKLDSNDSEDKDGANGNQNIDLSKDINAALKNYEKIWDKAFKSNKNKAVQLAQNIKKALLDGWNKGGDYTSLGSALSKWINKGLGKIPWGKIKTNTNKIAKSIGTFLNGAVRDLDWNLVGKTISEGLNTGIGFAYTFLTTFDFLKFGKSVSTGLNSSIKNLDWTLLGKTLGARLRAIIQTAFGFITTFDFSTLGKKIGDGINGFLSDMGKVDSRTGLSGWQELGKSLSDGAKGILDTINTALSTVKWDKVGKSIGEFLGEIDWIGVLGKLSNVLANAFSALFTTAIDAFKESPGGVSQAILALVGGLFAYKKLKGLVTGLKGNISTILFDAVKGTKIAQSATLLGKTFCDTLKTTIISSRVGTAVISAFTTVTGKISALATKIGTAFMGKITALFSSAAFVTTFTTAAIGAAAAVVAGLAIGNKLKEAIAAYYQTDEFAFEIPEGMKKASEKAQESLNNTLEKVRETKNVIGEINKSVQTTDGKNIEELADRYYRLSQKANPTASDIAVMKKYSEQLSEVIPDLSGKIDKQTGAFNGSKKALDGLVSSYTRAAKAEAAYNNSVSLYEKQIENKNAIDNKKKELKIYETEFKAAKSILKSIETQEGKNSERYKTQIKVVGTYANKVNACRSEIRALGESQISIGKQIKTNNNLMENAKIKTMDYNESSKKLRETMRNLGASNKEQKETLKVLKEQLNNGEISWKNYKKIVDGNYNSIDDLKNVISKLVPKSVSVTANVKGDDSVRSLGDKVDGLPDSKITQVGVNVEKSGIQKFNDYISKLKGNQIKIPIQFGITEEQLNILKKFKPGGNNPVFDNAVKKSGLPDIYEIAKKLPLIKGTYATGGFPEDGLFMANHSELVGKFGNGKTAVANNQQITQGFADGITSTLAPAIYSAVKQAISESGNSGGDVYIDGTKLTKAVMGNAEQIARSRGSGWRLA